jgi:hypothetical protein
MFVYIYTNRRDPDFCSLTCILHTYADRSRNAQISAHVHYFQCIPPGPTHHVSQLEDFALHRCTTITLHHRGVIKFTGVTAQGLLVLDVLLHVTVSKPQV